ncbi:ribonuclease H-like protein [Ganoderma leucocontextum]|nr:ribonuclease H-like protein [Ganoderma leucocontextum]
MDVSAPPSTSNTKPLRRSKILAALDAELPNWLSGPLVPDAVNLVADFCTHPSTTMGQLLSQPNAEVSEPTVEAGPSKPSSKGLKARATAVELHMHRAASDIENNPNISEDNVEDLNPITTNLKPTSKAKAPPTKSKSNLPLYSYKQYRPTPAVVYTQHEEEANDLVQSMKGPLGFDLEWVVTFRRGRAPMERRTALVQLCDARMILLVQVSAMKKFPQKVKEVIENKDIMKLGANIRNDGQKLFRDFGILPTGLVELGALARLADPKFSQTYNRNIVALAKVVEYYTHKTLDKGKVRTSDWEAKLSHAQITYSANDAHCALTVHNVLMAIAAENENEVDWKACAADLKKEYREKTVANHNAAASPVASSQATEASVEDKEPGQGSSTPTPTPAQTQIQLQLSRTTSGGWNPFARPPSSSGASMSRTSSQTTAGMQPTQPQREPPRPQHMRAYNLWHNRDMPLADICAALRSKDNPLAESTVISYVVRALQADPSLPFSMERLKAFVQLEAGSWRRHRDWILEVDGYKKA